MRKLLLIPLLLLFFVGCSQPKKDHAYVKVEPAVFIPTTIATTTTLPPTTTTVKPKVITKTTQRVSRGVQRKPNSAGFDGACGGNLPPCWVLQRESNGGNLSAYNPSGCAHKDGTSGCYGKWQCDPRTCDGTGTAEEQNAEAARVWDNGRGCSHWAAC